VTGESATQETLTVGGRIIQYELVRRPRRHMTISVYPDLRVKVSAPRSVGEARIRERVRRKAPWILRKISDFRRYHPLPSEKRYVAGETHLFLGRQYRLKIQEGQAEEVKLKGRFFHISVPDKNASMHIRRTLDAWYLERAKTHLPERLERFKSVSVHFRGLATKLTVSRMLKRWGSCTRRGAVRLNVDLIKAPVHCIDYVIAHELCHLRVTKHTPSFFGLLSRVMPDWERRKARLEEIRF
jgi:predicted metal-dependent hydrolase